MDPVAADSVISIGATTSMNEHDAVVKVPSKGKIVATANADVFCSGEETARSLIINVGAAVLLDFCEAHLERRDVVIRFVASHWNAPFETSTLRARALRAGVEHAVGRELEVGLRRLPDVDEGLRVAIREREPRALDVNHEAMPRAEGVAHVGARSSRGGLVRANGSGLSSCCGSAAHDLRAHELLVAAHPARSSPTAARPRANVDDLHHPSASMPVVAKYAGLDGPGRRHVAAERRSGT